MKKSFFFLMATLALGCDGEVVPDDDAGVDAGTVPTPAVVFDLGGEFFDAPYPSDLRTDANGHPDLTGFPVRRGLVDDGASLVEEERPGFSPITGVYFRFAGPLSATIDPDPAARTSEDSPIWLVDVDPDSPERGRLMPAYVTFYEDASRIWPGNVLAVRAVPGQHLHPGRRYAVAIRASLDPAIERSEAFEALKTDASGEVGAHYDELFTILEELGLPREEIVNATMFTVSDPLVEMEMARDYVLSQPLPEVRDWQLVRVSGTELRAQATFDTYELLEGTPPYEEFGSGRIRFNPDGTPVVVNRRPVRIGLTVPLDTMPPDGWPVVLYGHGTGGDHETHFGDEGTALAEVGIASLGLEAALHGERSPTDFEVENLIAQNPAAAREVVRQTVLDMMILYQLIEAGSIVVPAELNMGTPIPVSASPVMYMGHSQGSQEAGVLLGVEPGVEAAFMSEGGAAGIITIVERELTPGTPINCLIAGLVNEPCELMTEDHPLITLIIQPILDPADPVAFAHRFLLERPDTWAPLSLAMTEGTEDTYTAPRGIEALAVAIGLPIVEPVVQTTDAYLLVGSPSASPPVRGNLMTAGGDVVTGGVMQFEGEGHFAIYRNDDAKNRYVEFFRTFIANGRPTIVGPM